MYVCTYPEKFSIKKQILKFQRKVTHLQRQLSRLESEHGNDYQAVNTNVYFSATRKLYTQCQDCTFNYDKVHVNKGNAFIGETGVFTAPSAGNYYFQV